MANKILTYAGQSGNTTPGNGYHCPPHGDDPTVWLENRIEFYTSEVARLERELAHARALLKGHQIWLTEAQKVGER